MVVLSKAEQWKRAAILIAWWKEQHGNLGDNYSQTAIANVLELISPTAPWEYPWNEVVRSVWERSEAALAKRAK